MRLKKGNLLCFTANAKHLFKRDEPVYGYRNAGEEHSRIVWHPVELFENDCFIVMSPRTFALELNPHQSFRTEGFIQVYAQTSGQILYVKRHLLCRGGDESGERIFTEEDWKQRPRWNRWENNAPNYGEHEHYEVGDRVKVAPYNELGTIRSKAHWMNGEDYGYNSDQMRFVDVLIDSSRERVTYPLCYVHRH